MFNRKNASEDCRGDHLLSHMRLRNLPLRLPEERVPLPGYPPSHGRPRLPPGFLTRGWKRKRVSVKERRLIIC